MFLQKIKSFLYLGIFYLTISLVLRIIFIFHPITTADFSFFETIKILLIGVVNDSLVFVLTCPFLALYFLFLSDSKYQKPYGYIILGLLLLFFLYILLIPNNIFKQYGGSIAEIALTFIGIKIIFFSLMLFLPEKRIKIRNILYFVTIFLYVMLIIFNAVSEYFFYNEFGLRYNFIAVDYLIYTNEVIGNIMESYPVVPLFLGIFAIAAIFTIYIYRKTKTELLNLPNLKQKLILLVLFCILIGISLIGLNFTTKLKSENVFEEESEKPY